MSPKKIFVIFSIIISLGLVQACSEGPVEEAGEKIDNTFDKGPAEEAGESVDESIDKGAEKAEEAGENIKDKVD
jgi:hypothetical protein